MRRLFDDDESEALSHGYLLQPQMLSSIGPLRAMCYEQQLQRVSGTVTGYYRVIVADPCEHDAAVSRWLCLAEHVHANDRKGKDKQCLEASVTQA